MDILKIQNVNLYQFSLPLNRTLVVNGDTQTERQGVIIQLISESGIMGFGEASPLPGLSPEPLKKTVHQLECIKEEWRGKSVPTDIKSLLPWLSSRLPQDTFVPSVRFGLESAVLSMVAASRDMTMAELLSGSAPRAVITSGLLQGAPQEILSQAASMKAGGYRIFKVKLGNRNVPLDVMKVEGLKNLLGPDAIFRLDINGQWSADEAILFGRSIGKNQIQFVEDPCGALDAAETFYKRTDIPVALDEALVNACWDKIEASQGIQYLVVKPTLHGGITEFLKIIQQAQDLGRKVVISSSFESGIGLAILANLAVLTEDAAGLGTQTWFASDLLAEPIANPAGMIVSKKLTFHSEMLHSELRKRFKAV